MKKFLIFLVVLFIHSNGFALIKPYSQNNKYWEYNGLPVLLIGGSDTHNLFNATQSSSGSSPASLDVKAHLELLRSSGGNYIRNGMSSRDPGNVEPHLQLSSGLYDLNQWNPEYWNRFNNFLTWSRERNIIVQIEFWDRHDFVAENKWGKSSWNPRNNINYTSSSSGLSETYNIPAYGGVQPFLQTVPTMQNNTVVLPYQQAFINKILSAISGFENVLICINNETAEDLKWSTYWADYIKPRTNKYIADMRNDRDITTSQHTEMYNVPNRYTFVDISQNTHLQGQITYDRILTVWNSYISKNPRPMNITKIYGGKVGDTHGGDEAEGKKKFWRSIFAGIASVRFHRPDWGLGLGSLAQTQLKSASIFLSNFNIFNSIPDNSLINNRSTDSAYLLKNQYQYAIYIPNGGNVSINLPNRQFNKKVLNIDNSTISSAGTINGGNHTVNLSSNTQWLVFFEDINKPLENIIPPKIIDIRKL